MGRPSIDLTGHRFGAWSVLERADIVEGNARWLCECDCGTRRVVYASSLKIKTCVPRSCGCQWVKHLTQHGHAKKRNHTPTFSSWQSAKGRCFRETDRKFANYGGRGITMCDRWKNSFENFLADMGERPEGKTLDRYPDNDGNYEPGNCRWATPKQQARNRGNRKCVARNALA